VIIRISKGSKIGTGIDVALRHPLQIHGQHEVAATHKELFGQAIQRPQREHQLMWQKQAYRRLGGASSASLR